MTDVQKEPQAQANPVQAERISGAPQLDQPVRIEDMPPHDYVRPREGEQPVVDVTPVADRKTGMFLNMFDTRKKRIAWGIGSAAAGALTIALLWPKNSGPPPVVPDGPEITSSATPNPTETEASSTPLNQEMEAAIAARPEEGSPEYYALFAPMALPPTSETDPNKVIDAINVSAFITLPEIIAADAPGGGDQDSVVAWQFENQGKSLEDLVKQLRPAYFIDGAAVQLYGPDWKSDAETVAFVNTYLAPQVEQRLAAILTTVGSGTKKKITYTATNNGVEATETSIKYSGSTAQVQYPGGNVQELTVSGGELVINLDLGRWVGSPSL